MKIAFLHLAFCGNEQCVNKNKILQGMEIAARYGASWVITPEMALQGYHMIREDYCFQLASKQNGILEPFMQAAKNFKQRLFLGCGFVEDRIPHNSCVIINPDGTYYNQHSKVSVVKWVTEQWAHPGEKFEVWDLDGIRTSVMVCADMYYVDHAKAIKSNNAELIVGIACWPEGGHCGAPHIAWEKLSVAAGNIPLFISNQTGNKGMDCSSARSAVVDNGQLQFYHDETEAVLLIELDIKQKKIVSKQFTAIPY